jgi:glycosyltransferase involved in cell wall biosynthesis
MRVLHVARGGLDNQCDRLLVALARQRKLWPGMHSHFALCPPGRLGRELDAAGASVYDLGAMRARDPLSLWRARSRLRSLVDENRIEAVVCHRIQTFDPLSATARSIHRPLILWSHSPDDTAAWIRRPDEAAFADMVLCNSEFTASGLRALFSHVAIETIYYPIAPPECQHGTRSSIRRRHLAADGEVVILCPLEADGAEAMICAARQLRELSGWTIWFMPPHSNDKRSRDLAPFKHRSREAGIADRIQFISASDDEAQVLAAGDFYCEPNRNPQAFGWRMVEALYCGLPVLATALGAAPEILDESCAILVSAGEDDSLAAALRELIVNRELRARFGGAGPARAQALCEPRQQMRRLANCLARTTAFDLGSFEARTR